MSRVNLLASRLIIACCAVYSCVRPMQLKACDAAVWREYLGVRIWQFPGSNAYFYVVNQMSIDADGAPDAYHPSNRGTDDLKNAGYPNGGWRNVLVVDPDDSSKPYIRRNGPYAGYFISRTSLQDRTRPDTDPDRYVDASKIPYLVLPGAFYALRGTGNYGDLLVARNLSNSKTTGAVIADGGPKDEPLGEVSIALAERLGGKNVNPRTADGIAPGPYAYAVFPYTAAHPAWPVSDQTLQASALGKLETLGGWDRVLACINAH